MYEARKICNFLLAHYDAERFDLSNLRINKLLFFIHCEGLKTRPDGLVRNHFEAWKFGPVIRPVYDEFSKYGEGVITQPATFLDYSIGKQTPVPFSDITEVDRNLIAKTFIEYSRFTTGQLVALSHEPGGPWDVVFRQQLADKTLSPRIPNELIRAHQSGKSAVKH